MFKKFMALIIMGIMVLGMVGCGSAKTEENEGNSTNENMTTNNKTEAEKYPSEKVIIGVELYDPTEAETLQLIKYLDTISDNFNIDFKYSEAIADADAEMKFIEDCVAAGAKGFVAFYNVTAVEQVKAVTGYEMYYWGQIEGYEGYEEILDNPYYVGVISGGDYEYEAGKAIGEWVIENGYKKVIWSAGGATMGVPHFVSRQNGFLDGIGDNDIEIITVNGFPNDQFFADQAAALATDGVEAVCASFNGIDFWAQPIATAGLEGKVKLATIGSINQAYLDAFESGKVDLVCAMNIQGFGLAATMITNAIDGNRDNLNTDGHATSITAPGWIVGNGEDFKKLYAIQNNEGIYTMEDLKSFCKSVNPDATYQTLYDLVQNTALDKLLNR